MAPSLVARITKLHVETWTARSSSLSSEHPLFPIALTLCALLLIYFPRVFLNVVLSPSLNVGAVVMALALLIRIGAAPEAEQFKRVGSRSVMGRGSEMGSSPDRCSEVSFAGWDVKAPLGVIHEGYEGQEDNDGGGGPNVYGGPTPYVEDTDSEASLEGKFTTTGGDLGSPDRWQFRWDSLEDAEGLIEIALDLDGEEENMIEIEVSPARKNPLFNNRK
ncbi:uncharacterized protein LOC115690859 [Syzygium oleosum]|uniref:uncharacterized protein LOC115690859 n=1 Tax=Syzygium oleosum TaxID=219896 RepID=UPI0024BB88E1|nr:uncharacterized protein LOC115690859 [Syzygium oleosum]